MEKGALEAFCQHLIREEKSKNTIQKYTHDVTLFMEFLRGRPVNKEVTAAYKERLLSLYAVSSANSMLAAMNTFLEFLGLADCKVRPYKLQRRLFSNEDKELSFTHYKKMIELARADGNDRLLTLMQTLCNTGIRISELPYITAEAVRAGRATVKCKGKIREIFIHKELQKMLIGYAGRHGIISGPVFVTRTGKPVDRSNVWREMQKLSRRAKVDRACVFPHNLRHLFARTYYKAKKDIARLADILGHSNIQTTRIYIATTGKQYRRELAGLGLLIT